MNINNIKIILSLFGLFLITSVSADSIITLNRDRPPLLGSELVTQSVLQVVSPEPMGVFVMLTGGSGMLNIEDGKVSINTKTFLLRSRDYFSSEGYHALLMDVPSDIKQSGTGLTGYRLSAEHVSDILTVINYARDTFPGLPVWLIGVSRGSSSAANAAAILNSSSSAPDGLVLVASLTRPGVAQSESLEFVPLELITSPVLLVHHKKDACHATPVEDVKVLKKRLKTNSSKVSKMIFNGGSKPIQGSCAPLSYHTFFGIERKVITKITKWVYELTN